MTNEHELPRPAAPPVAPEEKEILRQEDEAALDLARAMFNPDYESMTLRHQAHTLDRMFRILAGHYLDTAGGRHGYAGYERLYAAIQVQKQCVDTLRAAGAIAYMASLAARNPQALPPPPGPRRTE